jgi:hypothetical protein
MYRGLVSLLPLLCFDSPIRATIIGMHKVLIAGTTFSSLEKRNSLS